MLGKNLRYYRLQAGLSQEELAEKIGAQKMTISNYENDKRMPDSKMLEKICSAVGVTLSKLLDFQAGPVELVGGKFRKNSDLSAIEAEAIIASVQNEANRYVAAASFVGLGTLDSLFPAEFQAAFASSEESAQYMRQLVGVAPRGPIGNLMQALENVGILVVLVDNKTSSLSGYSCRSNYGFPIIAIGKAMTAERQRFTMAHELAHLIFDQIGRYPEKKLDDVAGRFLVPREDIIRELGRKRSSIGTPEIKALHDEYGVSGQCISLRAHQENIISYAQYQRIAEVSISSTAVAEQPTRIAQLVYRAFFEGQIGISKVAELLSVSISQAREMCGVEVSAEW